MSDRIWTLKSDTGDNGDGMVLERRRLRVWATALARACSGDLVVAEAYNGSWDICAYGYLTGYDDTDGDIVFEISNIRRWLARTADKLRPNLDRYPSTSFTGCVLGALDADIDDCLPGQWAAPRVSTVNDFPAVLVPLDGGYADQVTALIQLPLKQYPWALIHAEALS